MPNEGSVCRKCWLKVSIFHEFYDFIQSVHATGHTVFLECDAKDDLELSIAENSVVKVENAVSDDDCEAGDDLNLNELSNSPQPADDKSLNSEQFEQKTERIVANTEKAVVKPTQKKRMKKPSDKNVKKIATKKGAANTFQ